MQGKTPGKLPAAPGSKMNPLSLKGKGNENWAQFQGKVKTDAQDAGQDALDEYRDLVQRYFEELSRQGDQARGK